MYKLRSPSCHVLWCRAAAASHALDAAQRAALAATLAQIASAMQHATAIARQLAAEGAAAASEITASRQRTASSNEAAEQVAPVLQARLDSLSRQLSRLHTQHSLMQATNASTFLRQQLPLLRPGGS